LAFGWRVARLRQREKYSLGAKSTEPHTRHEKGRQDIMILRQPVIRGPESPRGSMANADRVNQSNAFVGAQYALPLSPVGHENQSC